jgi:alpha-glucosidase (family GH31 glycosyl hydrolase)
MSGEGQHKMLDRVDFGECGVCCIYSGNGNLQQILGAIQQYLTHPDCSNYRYIVHDFTNVTSFDFAEVEFSGLASYALVNYQATDRVPRYAVTQNDTIRRCLSLYAELTGRNWNFVSRRSEINV